MPNKFERNIEFCSLEGRKLRKCLSSTFSPFLLRLLMVSEKRSSQHHFGIFVWGFKPYQQYFIYLTATVHKSMFPTLF